MGRGHGQCTHRSPSGSPRRQRGWAGSSPQQCHAETKTHEGVAQENGAQAECRISSGSSRKTHQTSPCTQIGTAHIPIPGAMHIRACNVGLGWCNPPHCPGACRDAAGQPSTIHPTAGMHCGAELSAPPRAAWAALARVPPNFVFRSILPTQRGRGGTQAARRSWLYWCCLQSFFF